MQSLTDWLEGAGYRVFYAEVELGSHGRWQRVLAGAYTEADAARRDADRLTAAAPSSGVRVVSADFANGVARAVSRVPAAVVTRRARNGAVSLILDALRRKPVDRDDEQGDEQPRVARTRHARLSAPVRSGPPVKTSTDSSRSCLASAACRC